jgi:hypothetical protein
LRLNTSNGRNEWEHNRSDTELRFLCGLRVSVAILCKKNTVEKFIGKMLLVESRIEQLGK